MSVLLLAMSTTRATAVRTAADFLLEHGEDVALITVDAEAWQREGMDPRVRIHPLQAAEQRHPLARLGSAVRRLSPAAYTKGYLKIYRLLRPYVLWRATRAGVGRELDWAAIRQVVVCDSHAIPIGWHLAKRHPRLTVGFELDRTAYLGLQAPQPGRQPVPSAPSGND
ncbi:MAG TPA: hypothetical protein VFA06_02345 [Actinocrinis sp.]|uniref:hypothetical protein n=1 Tax=Actinocrinis sp. TaxID=1920516 RepID=UPI002D406A42|nr:hypothetical protein [Actinocrinis sp.]HZU54687.1 hypothetical protein [Actinocrinis sp.]